MVDPARHAPAAGRGRIATAAAAALFGTSATATRLVDGMPDALTIAAWRQIIGGLALVAVAAATGRAVWRSPPRWAPSLIGGAAVVAFQVGFFAAVDRLGVATATMVVIGTGPIAAGALDRWLHGIRPTRRWIAGVAIAIGGIAVMSGGPGHVVAADWLLAVVAGACFPVYGAATRALLADRPPVAALATVFGAGVIPAAALAALGAAGMTLPGADLDRAVAGAPTPEVAAGAAPVVAVLIYLGLVTTASAYLLWAYGLARLSLGETVTITMLEPVAAFVLAATVLHEPLGVGPTAGAIAVLVGIRTATVPGRTRPAGRSRRSGRRAGGDLVDVAHRGARGDRGEQHQHGADREDDALVPQPVTDLVDTAP
jgi:DME family drug/metabolite transporter